MELEQFEIPALKHHLSNIYDHLPPDTKEEMIQLDTIIQEKNQALAMLDYQNEVLHE